MTRFHLSAVLLILVTHPAHCPGGDLAQRVRLSDPFAAVQPRPGIQAVAECLDELPADAISQSADGVIFLPAEAATKIAHDGTCVWTYKATRWGMYDVTVHTRGRAGTVRATLNDEDLAGKAVEGHQVVRLGRYYMASAGRQVIRAHATAAGGEGMLVGMTLHPAPEGKPVTQAEDGTITLHARDVTIHGITVRYEPHPKKQCIGYWTNPRDWVSWDFTVTHPGAFTIRLHQGCGKGHGGSTARITVAGRSFEHMVTDTGHFQNFVAHELGTVNIEKPGPHTLVVRPIRKAKVALMDIRKIELAPAGPRD